LKPLCGHHKGLTSSHSFFIFSILES